MGEVAGGDGPAAAPFGFRENGFAADVGAFATEHGDVLQTPGARIKVSGTDTGQFTKEMTNNGS